MSALLELATRCEAATGPDRELDAVIAATLRVGTEYGWADSYPAWKGRDDGRVYLCKGGPSFPSPNYTASLDAAMTLVPEGFQFGAGSRDASNRAWAWCGTDHEKAKIANAGSPALAFCAAALRARATGEQP